MKAEETVMFYLKLIAKENITPEENFFSLGINKALKEDIATDNLKDFKNDFYELLQVIYKNNKPYLLNLNIYKTEKLVLYNTSSLEEANKYLEIMKGNLKELKDKKFLGKKYSNRESIEVIDKNIQRMDAYLSRYLKIIKSFSNLRYVELAALWNDLNNLKYNFDRHVNIFTNKNSVNYYPFFKKIKERNAERYLDIKMNVILELTPSGYLDPEYFTEK